MKKDEFSDLVDYVEVVKNSYPDIPNDDLFELYSISRKLHNLNLAESCRGLRDWEERKVNALETRAVEIATTFGMTLIIQSDPRGYPIKIVLPSGRSNSFGMVGWGIPY